MQRILLIDENRTSRLAIARFLLEREFGCVAVSTPEELGKDGHGDTVDLLILAIHDRPEEGLAIIRDLHAHPHTAALPILVLTDDGSLDFSERIFAAGAAACLGRPFKLGALLSKIEGLFREESDAEVVDAGLSVPDHLAAHYARIRETGRELGDVAEIHTGLHPRLHKFRRMASPSPEWSPALVEGSIHPFHISAEREFFLVNRVGVVRIPPAEEYHVTEKVVLRRTLSPVTAAVDTAQRLIAPELYSIVTVKGLLCGYLVCVLMSRLMDFYFHRVRPPAEGLRGVYLSRADLEAMPLLILKPRQQGEFATMAQTLARCCAPDAGPSQAIEKGRLLATMNTRLFSLWGFDEQAVRQLTDLHY